MGKFSNLIKHFARISRLEDFWRNKGEQAGIRGLFMAIAANASVLIGVAVQILSGSYFYALLAATCSLTILFPLAIVLASRYWKHRIRTVVADDEDFNWRMFLEDEYEEQLRRIDDLGLDREDAGELKIEAYREHQEIVRLFQAKVASRPRQLPPQSIDELKSILRNIEYDLSRRDPQKFRELKGRLDELEERAKGYLS